MASSNSTTAPSQLNITKEVAALERLTVGELRERYQSLFNEATRATNRTWLIRRICWRMQSLAEGELSERARQRAMELAKTSDLRVTAPRTPKVTADASQRTSTLPFQFGSQQRVFVGMAISREYKGRTLNVIVQQNGFEFEGELYKSLSAVAKKVTGSHWNGYRFFNLLQEGGKQ